MQMCIVIYHILISLIIEPGIDCSCILFLYMSFPEHQEPEDPYGWRCSSRNILQHSPWVSYDDRNTESEATGFWSTVHTHKRTETLLAHTPGSWNRDLWTSPTIHHGLASSAFGWVSQLRNIRTHRHLWPICTQRVLGAVYQTLETLRLTFILMRPNFPSFSLSIRIVYIRVLHCNSF